MEHKLASHVYPRCYVVLLKKVGDFKMKMKMELMQMQMLMLMLVLALVLMLPTNTFERSSQPQFQFLDAI